MPMVRSDARVMLPRSYLMCPPEYFRVAYAINPWMDPTAPVDTELALKQWRRLRETLGELGHAVYELPPVPGLPDLVYAANGGFMLDGIAYGARFRHPERVAEAAVHRRWYEEEGWRLAPEGGAAAGSGVRYVVPAEVNEGEGDLVWTGGVILAGHGFRTTRAAHREVAETFRRPVVSVRLVDPRFYHLDTALTVLGDGAIAYYPAAFSEASQRRLRSLFPDAMIVDEADAVAFGLNLVSDGRHVVLNADATGMAARLARAGYVPVPVELSELKKGGGSVKCCAQELRPRNSR